MSGFLTFHFFQGFLLHRCGEDKGARNTLLSHLTLWHSSSVCVQLQVPAGSTHHQHFHLVHQGSHVVKKVHNASSSWVNQRLLDLAPTLHVGWSVLWSISDIYTSHCRSRASRIMSDLHMDSLTLWPLVEDWSARLEPLDWGPASYMNETHEQFVARFRFFYWNAYLLYLSVFIYCSSPGLKIKFHSFMSPCWKDNRLPWNPWNAFKVITVYNNTERL